MPTFEEARTIILAHIKTLGTEEVMLLDATGRVLAEEIAAPWDIPLWDNSAMDGYAVRSADCREEVTLPISAFIPAGSLPHLPIGEGTAIKIMTGAPVPPGADAVVPYEETEEGDGWVKITGPVVARRHIRFQGEDVQAGESVLRAGTVIRPPEISMLASCGQLLVPVFRRPRVAVLSTGDELVEPGEPIAPGKIINSNTLALAAAIRELGADPVILGIARDNREDHRQKIGEGLLADVLITSAGVSTGDRDLVRETLEELGVLPLFWNVEIKPGQPTAFGMKNATPVFSLPGNPVSTLVTFQELVRPALLKIMGHRRIMQSGITALLREEVRKKPGRLHFMRVRIEIENGRYIAETAGDQNTGILTTMVRANGLALLPADRGVFPAGTEVQVHLLDRGFEMLEG
jgi:molybdopterin molybdotransferase